MRAKASLTEQFRNGNAVQQLSERKWQFKRRLQSALQSVCLSRFSRRSQIELRCDNDLKLENEKKKQEAVDAE